MPLDFLRSTDTPPFNQKLIKSKVVQSEMGKKRILNKQSRNSSQDTLNMFRTEQQPKKKVKKKKASIDTSQNLSRTTGAKKKNKKRKSVVIPNINS